MCNLERNSYKVGNISQKDGLPQFLTHWHPLLEHKPVVKQYQMWKSTWKKRGQPIENP